MSISLITQHIFGEKFIEELKADYQTRNPDFILDDSWTYSLKDVKLTINKVLNKLDVPQEVPKGILGPPETVFDVDSKGRNINVSLDKLTVTATGGFGTIHANSALFKGKWQYEAQLAANGIMQIGWCTPHCKFRQESGVGDTTHSYAYDGCRQKKWNMATYNYGEAWLGGDIIGTTIDLDEGTIEFFRNGFSMGIAFEKIQIGQGMAYFPGISLANSESIRANFGSSPFVYPVPGFEPIQRAPKREVEKAKLILEWIHHLIDLNRTDKMRLLSDGIVTLESMVYLFASLLFNNLSLFLSKPYIIDVCMLSFLKRLMLQHVSEVPLLNVFLDYMWMLVDSNLVNSVLNMLVKTIESTYRRIAYNIDYPHQRDALHLMLAVLQHEKTRKYLLKNVLFDSVMIQNFMHIKPLDDRGLSKIIPLVWWEQENEQSERNEDLIKENAKNKMEYSNSCKRMFDSVTDIEMIQLDILRALLINHDGNKENSSSRKIFLENLRNFLFHHLSSLGRIDPQQTLGPTLLSFFQRLLSILQDLWEEEMGETPVEVPTRIFYDTSVKYVSFVERLGGLLRFLYSKYRTQLMNELGPDHKIIVSRETDGVGNARTFTNIFGTQTESTNLLSLISAQITRSSVTLQNTGAFHLQDLSSVNRASAPYVSVMSIGPGNMDSRQSLVELIDSIILFYTVAANKQLVKVASIKTSMKEFTKCYLEYTQKLKLLHPASPIAVQLSKSCQVLRTNINMLARHIAWIRSAIFSEDKQMQIVWLLKTVIRVFEDASKDIFLSFVPLYYLQSMLEMSTLLRTHFDPLMPLKNISDPLELLKGISEFLAQHLYDPLIVHVTAKDLILQSSASFICSPLALQAMESIRPESKERFAKALLQPYEGRSWAQSNWILVRVWHGCGFAFRYTQSPHLSQLGPHIMCSDSNLICQAISPRPSLIYQQQIQRILLDKDNQEMATLFLNSLLNQLNKTFSEFIEMIQEIQNLSTRMEKVWLETRHLRICATCFDLSVCLLRVLEMIVTLARPLFCDTKRPNSSSLLERLCQILCQLFNRCCSATSGFNYIISLRKDQRIAQLQTIDAFPILGAIAGILSALVGEEVHTSKELAPIPTVIRAVLSEPSFQISDIQFLLNENQNREEESSHSNSTIKPFTFESYPNEVSSEEIDRLRQIIKCCEINQRRLSVVGDDDDEENKCSICYAAFNSAKFHPCGHLSCRSCISHHLMNDRRCFFCKTTVDSVTQLDGKPILTNLTSR